MTASEPHAIPTATKVISSPRPSRSARTVVLLILAVAMSGVMMLGQTSVAQARAVRVQDREIAQLAEEALEALSLWRSDESPAHYVAYLEGRDLVARGIASQLNVDSTSLEDAWRELPLVRQVVTLTAVAQTGIKYRYLGKDPDEGFDCSGLTGFAWNAAGLTIGTYSRAQYLAATRVPRELAQAGDLFWYPGHIGMYLGADDIIIHAPFTGRNVEIRQMTPKRIRNVRFASPLN